MDFPQLINILWQRHGTVVSFSFHYVHAIKRQGSCLTPAHLPSLRGASGSVFRRGQPASAIPGFDPWTFGSKVQFSARVATETARPQLLKLRVYLPLLFPYCFSLLFCLSVSYFILCPQLQWSQPYEILHDCSMMYQKRFGVFPFSIFGQAQWPCPFRLS